MNTFNNLWLGTKVGFRRLAKGKKRPTWSWFYETFVEVMQADFAIPLTGRVEKARKTMDATGDKLLRPNQAKFQEAEIGGVHCLWAEPETGAENSVILYLHGGGYAVGSVLSHRTIMAELAHRTGVRVLGVDYRLAPEHPCPAAIEDVVNVFNELPNLGIEQKQCIFIGDSAGGGLSVSSIVALRDRVLPAAAVLYSPWTDLTLSGSSLVENEPYDFISTDGLRELVGKDFYARDLGPEDPRVSPLFADLQGLPPMLIIAGGSEVLLDDSRRLAEKAKEAGVDVELHIEPDEIHVYPLFVGYSYRAEDALRKTTEFVRSHLLGE